MSHHVIKLTYPVSLKFQPLLALLRRQGLFVSNLRHRTTNEVVGVISPALHSPSIGGEKPFKPVRRTIRYAIRTYVTFSVQFPTGWSEWRRSGQIGWPYQPIQGLRFGFLRVGDEPSVFPRTARQQFSLCVCVCDRDSGGGGKDMRAVAVVTLLFWAFGIAERTWPH